MTQFPDPPYFLQNLPEWDTREARTAPRHRERTHMRWQRKAFIQRFLSRAPYGHHLLYLLQRYASKTLPQPRAKFLEVYEIEAGHIQNCLEFGETPLGEATFFQFGAGWTMAGPLAFHALGVNQQILVDIRRLIRPELINRTIHWLQTLDLSPQPVRIPRESLASDVRQAVAELNRQFGIDYRAPLDARETGLPSDSIDYVTSTNTLEHIPPEDIDGILKECRRILKPGGLMSFRVDYQDHYSYFDRTISAYNFLQFSDQDWGQFNPSLHFQNRLRHCDYLQMYQSAGFEVVAETPLPGTDEDLEELRRLALFDRFREYDVQEIAIRRSDIILKKPIATSSTSRSAA